MTGKEPAENRTSRAWQQMSDAEYDELNEKALAAALKFIDEKFISESPIISERLADSGIVNRAKIAVFDCIYMQADFEVGDPYRELRETAAKVTLPPSFIQF